MKEHLDGLKGVLVQVQALLEAGLDGHRHGFRLPVLASVDSAGKPAARALILRHVDFDAREIRLHTDSRTRKMREIEAYPDVTLVFTDRTVNVQLQLKGRASLHRLDAYAQDAWNNASPSSRRAYLAVEGPGSVMARPGSGLPADVTDSVPDEVRLRDGRGNFAAIRVHFDAIEWLLLDGSENRRAAFTFEAGEWRGHWCVP
ncbi:MAG: pyridoxamine 5'-phosphate oxidase family protein [Parvibaculum sp.]